MKSLQKSFVRYFRSPSKDRTRHGTRYRSRRTSRSTSRGRIVYDKSTNPPHILVHKMTIIQKILDLTVLLVDPCIALRIDMILVTDIDLACIIDITFSPGLHPQLDHLQDEEILGTRSHSNTRNKLNTIQPQTSNDPINSEVHLYHPTEMANALTPTSCIYSLYCHTPLVQSQRDFPS